MKHSAEQETIRKLRNELELYKNIVDEAFEGISAVDKDGIVIVYNKEIAKTEEMNAEDVIGKKETEVYNDPEYDFPQVIQRANTKDGNTIINQRYLYKTPNGKEHHIIFSAFPYYYDGEYQGTFTIGRDVMQINSFINATMALEHQLKQSKQKMTTEGAYYFLDNIIGASPQMKKAVNSAEKIAAYEIPVMIIGETGTGKELFAQGIHNASAYRKGPFISLNCAALPESLLESILFGTSKGSFTGAIDMPGLFEQAENGSLFLDEINSMPPALQGKLLRAIQEKRIRRLGGKNEININCRIISATNQDPFDPDQKEDIHIRSDLLFRLSAAVVQIPPLRERKEDIHELCKYFLRRSNQNKSIFLWDISPELLEMFYHYDWPGNVRELENVIYSSIIFADNQERFLKTEHIPEHLQKSFFQNDRREALHFMQGNLKEATEDFEKRFIIDTIYAAHGNISKAAKALGISRQNLYAKIHKYHLERLINPKV